jgi:Xaa-Pro aminopeptidase
MTFKHSINYITLTGQQYVSIHDWAMSLPPAERDEYFRIRKLEDERYEKLIKEGKILSNIPGEMIYSSEEAYLENRYLHTPGWLEFFHRWENETGITSVVEDKPV